jgi:hypothetical protein
LESLPGLVSRHERDHNPAGAGGKRNGWPACSLTQHETVEDLLSQSARGIVPIRKSFVQQGRGKDTRPGPLASFVTAHDARALDAYLFVHALASAEPWNCDYPAGTWVRALGLGAGAEAASARGAVSKVMKRLEDRNLVTRSRSGRRSSVTLLREDGSGKPYEHPHRAGSDRWLQLPYAYWLEGHYLAFSLPAKAMLLPAILIVLFAGVVALLALALDSGRRQYALDLADRFADLAAVLVGAARPRRPRPLEAAKPNCGSKPGRSTG